MLTPSLGSGLRPVSCTGDVPGEMASNRPPGMALCGLLEVVGLSAKLWDRAPSRVAAGKGESQQWL